MSVLEIWGAEYQENNALLIKPESTELFLAMAERENCPASLLGKVSGDGRVTVKDSRDGSVPYDLPLKVPLYVFCFAVFYDIDGHRRILRWVGVTGGHTQVFFFSGGCLCVAVGVGVGVEFW